ncbi:MAG: hypothetical protein FP825_06535 [Hyphomonas sp.]|uniref:hypothetical protein n=1 Tax=Hyphomonas sp. TaxID=87 RepID=UPI0018455BD8|nr:hypothetical protein [Hyphomonas sp.]MBA3068117.1 hypothetical protein [Hyphomonas sp.]MBU3922433.1 hypothetical protein [Alphaproteobacteria bacterium]MBU4061456.1 hypothetical protein [Alphaproteobacteria bacterium]MBU4165024.1 hypothetical protein [Alphaproteobacteria bacterium]
MKNPEQLKAIHDAAADELCSVDAAIARLLESRTIAGTVPGGVSDSNLAHLRDRARVLRGRIDQTGAKR